MGVADGRRSFAHLKGASSRTFVLYDMLCYTNHIGEGSSALKFSGKATDGMAKRTHIVKFDAHKIEKAPVKFTTSNGEKVSFEAKQGVIVPVKFRAKN
jgi:hypothetical protein